MGASTSGLVTTQAVVARRPQPLAVLGLRLVVARQPQLGVIKDDVLVLGVVIAANSVSCPLFACPFVVATQPSSSMAFRTSRTCLCPKLPIGSSFNNTKWLSI